MNECTLVLDVGGQSCRALAVDDADGRIRFESSRHVAVAETGLRSERNADELAAAVVGVAASICRDAAEAGLAVLRAGLAVERGSVVCWNRSDGAALSPVISWRDRRALPGLEHLAGQAAEIKRRTGLRFSPYGGACKLAWCLKHLAAVHTALEDGQLAFGPLGSFLLDRLLESGPCRVDPTLAQRTLLWSAQRFAWDPWLLARFGLSRSALPELVDSQSRHGHLRCAQGRVPMELLLGDQNAVPWIDGCPRIDTLYINLGTGAFLLRPLNQPIADERFQLTLLERGEDPGWALEGSVHGAASALSWLGQGEPGNAAPDRHRGLRARCSDPPLFLNTVDGLGSPWWQSGPEPEWIGDHGDADARLLAVLESIAFLIRANVDAMASRVGLPKRVVLSGGLSRSATLCGLIADLVELPTVRLVPGEATALGLWSRLHRRAVPDDQFEPVYWQPARPLQERYRCWTNCLRQSLR